MRISTAHLIDIVQAILAALWVGTMWSTGALVAPALFRMIDDRALAGDVAGHLFGVTAFVGFAAGGCLLLLRLIEHRCAALRQPLFWLVVSMITLVCLMQFGVQPILAGLREQAHPEQAMQTALANSFATWHAVAGILYIVVSALGLVLVALVVQPHRHSRTP